MREPSRFLARATPDQGLCDSGYKGGSVLETSPRPFFESADGLGINMGSRSLRASCPTQTRRPSGLSSETDFRTESNQAVTDEREA